MKRLACSLSLFWCILLTTSVSCAKCWEEGPRWARFKVCDSENLGRDIQREGGNAIDNLQRGGQRALDAAGGIIEQATIPPGVSEYIAYLERQAQGREKALPSDFLAIVGPHYVKAPLSLVRYAEGINTIHGQAITVGNRIYFPSAINLSEPHDLQWMLHELEHVSQYNVHDGVTPFLIKYLVQGGIQMRKNGFNVHDSISLEADAENKAVRILNDVLAKLPHRGGTRVTQSSSPLITVSPRVPESVQQRPNWNSSKGVDDAETTQQDRDYQQQQEDEERQRRLRDAARRKQWEEEAREQRWKEIAGYRHRQQQRQRLDDSILESQEEVRQADERSLAASERAFESGTWINLQENNPHLTAGHVPQETHYFCYTKSLFGKTTCSSRLRSSPMVEQQKVMLQCRQYGYSDVYLISQASPTESKETQKQVCDEFLD